MHSIASNTCFAGLVEYLQGKEGVKDVEVRPGRPAGAAEISSWEEGSGCVMPEDLKMFYLTHNGLDLRWSYLHHNAVVSLGRVHVNSLGELRPLVTTQSHTHSTNKPSLNDLESESAGDGDWQPSLCSGAECCVFVLDHCHTCGHTCLVFTHNSHTDHQTSQCSVWLLDLGLSWHHLSHSFSDYLRLVIVHLGLRQWPYAVTPNRLSPEHEYWFHILAPHRLEVDATQHHSTSTSTVMWAAAGETVEKDVVDVSKILRPKPPRDKRIKDSKSANKQQRRASATKTS